MMFEVFGFLTNVIDKIFPDAGERERVKLLLLKLEQEGELARIAAQSNIIMAEAQSQDKWTSRARPSFMYVFYMILMMLTFGAVISVWYPGEVRTAAFTFKELFEGIPEPMWWTFTAGYLGYTGARTWEKGKGVADGSKPHER